jgi:hypothetical protein
MTEIQNHHETFRSLEFCVLEVYLGFGAWDLGFCRVLSKAMWGTHDNAFFEGTTGILDGRPVGL